MAISKTRMNNLERISKEELRRTPKSPKLSLERKIAIGKWARRHPKLTTQDIADRYQCSYAQARAAIKDYEAGALGTPRLNVPRKKVSQIILEKTAEQILMEEFHKAVAELSTQKNMDLQVRIKLIGDLTSMRRELQRLQLQSHMKAADAGVVAAIIRRYQAEATEDDIIKIYMEATAMSRMSDAK